MTSVWLDGVTLDRGSFRLEADCTFGPGLHGVTGRIGSGKSTLALALAGALRPTAGAIRLDGVRRRLLVVQSPDHHLTGATVEAEAASWGVADPGALLDAIGLAGCAAADPFRLSRGEQKRLVLGCAILADADLLVLDEPFASLDVPASVRLGRALARRAGVTIVMTHAERYLRPGASRWRTEEGRLLPEGT
jgi:energy-coupling factor transport system ATP-binding protein